jgi:hypothetical protein
LGSDVYPVIEQLSRPAFLGGASADRCIAAIGATTDVHDGSAALA